MKIKNREEMLAAGEGQNRRIVLDLLESVLQRIDAYHVVRGMLALRGDLLSIGAVEIDLSKRRDIHVIGAGKAGNAMARGVEEVLGERIRSGIVVVKQLEPGERLRKIELVPGGHPIPNKEGHLASRRIMEKIAGASPDDLFIGLISGGSSALLNYPIGEISLKDEIETTEALLKSGARIIEINAVRRHISAVNGGRLARAVEERGAEMINLIVSDGVGNVSMCNPRLPTPFFGTPVAPDATTLADAKKVLQKYELIDRIPLSVIDYLNKAGPTDETPKTLGPAIRHFVLMRPGSSCEAALEAASEKGLEAMVLTTFLEGESREAGVFLASVAKEIAANRRPLSPPCILIAGGETTTAIADACGLGGPSQELALSFALEIDGKAGICLGAIDTDGTDGPTHIAGGLVDGTTARRLRLKGLEGHGSLRSHDSAPALAAVGDHILTGNTGTNVCDLNIIYIG